MVKSESSLVKSVNTLQLGFTQRQKATRKWPINYLCCLDIDECAIKTDNCSLHAICSNTEGSFNCSCKDGFSVDGISCTGNYQLLSHIILSTCYLLNDDEFDDDNEVFCAGVSDKTFFTGNHGT